MSGYFPFAPLDASPQGTGGAAALTTATVYPNGFTGYTWAGYAALDVAVLLTSSGGGTVINTLYIHPQWSDVAAPSAASDWNDFTREEFNVAAAPTSNGTAVESAYEASYAVVAGDLPKRFGFSLRVRGLWFRIGVRGDGAVAAVNRLVTYTRRSAG